MAVRRRDKLLVMAHGSDSPSQPEWNEAMRLIADVEPVSDARILAYSTGGAPTTLQRGELNDLTGELSPRIALLTGSRVVRTVGVAVGWFQRGFQTFRPTELGPALDHLGVEGDDRAWAERALADACDELGMTPPGGA